MNFLVFYESVTDRRTDRQTDRPTDGRTDGRTDRPSYRDVRTHLKTYHLDSSEFDVVVQIALAFPLDVITVKTYVFALHGIRPASEIRNA